tara:strand:+ start:58 stop:1317 length:1260 start_codon:yes stop_codon:yes gene_type:complete
MDGDNFKEVENNPKSSKWIIFLIGGIVLVILLVGAYFLFQGLSKSSDSSSSLANQESTENQDSKSQIQGQVIKCDDIPKDFDAQDETYLNNNPEVKEDLLCISEAFADCKDSDITFLGEQVDNILSIKKEDNKCVIDYKSGTKSIKCEYTPSQTKMLHEVSIDNNHPELTGLGIAFAMGMELTFGFKSGETKEQEITNKDTGQKEKIPCTFYGSGDETIEQENSNNNVQEGLIVNGKEVQQGVAIYNQYNPEECLYSVYFSCDYFNDGCDDDSIMQVCKDSCYNTGGREYGSGGFGRLEENGVVNAIQCSCSQCTSSENGEKDFEFINTRTICRDSFGKNGIEVVVKNIGSSDISKDDWIVHKIDGEIVEVWPFSIKVGESGQVFTVVRTKDNDYTTGEHNIEIGLSEDNIKSTKVTCP